MGTNIEDISESILMWTIDGERCSLEIGSGGTVLVAQSFSCPYCRANSQRLDHLALKWESLGWNIRTVYVEESHPGEQISQPRDIIERRENARKFKVELGVRRPIYVDDMSNCGFGLFNEQPNSVLIVNTKGEVTLTSNWFDAEVIDDHLRHLLWATTAIKAGGDLRFFEISQQRFDETDTDRYLDGLRENGPTAVLDVVSSSLPPQRGAGTHSSHRVLVDP